MSRALSTALLVVLFAAGSVSAATGQFAFHAPTDSQRSAFVNAPLGAARDASEFYQFKWPIRRVAIIGAGVSGLLAYRELVDAGFDAVRIFDRDAVPGGNWHYTDETPVAAPVPNRDPKFGDYEPSLPPVGVAMPFERVYADHNDSITTAERWRRHRAPHALWKSLTSNVPAVSCFQRFNGHDWPAGTPWHLTQTLLTRYLRSVYSFYGINSNDESGDTSYSTRVELVEKRVNADGVEQGWTLTLKKFIRLGPSSSKERWWTEDFDAVVVCTGTFNAPNMPDIPGLAEWTRRFPGSVLHSREYRDPAMFANQSVLVVGGGTSAAGISVDINPFVQRHYLSFRVHSTTPPIFLQLLPQGVEVVVGITHFHPLNSTIELSDGMLLTDVDHIIFSTGYQYSFPFLPQYHNSSIGANEAVPEDEFQPLVTDGSHFRSLYREFIYIEEPTLAFMNLNLGTVTFTFGEYFAVALAKIWSGTAMLPNQAEMWKSYRAGVVARGGYGKWLTYLAPGWKNMTAHIAFFSAWINSAAYEFGGKTVCTSFVLYCSFFTGWNKIDGLNKESVY
ncbi:FAD/NAD(P)-binding domain-containing protein [Mycena vulgaris]|nr:FAD/NAD(P)-binding domain-containing protein [Mycena vulgaris]